MHLTQKQHVLPKSKRITFETGKTIHVSNRTNKTLNHKHKKTFGLLTHEQTNHIPKMT